MTIAPEEDARSDLGPNSMNAVSRPRPAPGFDSTMYRIDLPVSATSIAASGVKMPWLIALLRNSTLPGSTNSEASGSRFAATSQFTPSESTPTMPATTGPTPRVPRIANSMPKMPSEKLSTTISKPARTLPSMARSNCLRTQPAKGPMIIAPRNIGVPVRVANSVMPPMITPAVAMAPITAPRCPWTIFPPV